MSAFVGGGRAQHAIAVAAPLTTGVPRAGVPPAAFEVQGWGASAAAVTPQAVAVVALCSFLLAARRRVHRGRSRVALGPTGGTWHEYKFRAKPGDRYKYRYSTDVHTPEFGHYPPEAKGRLVQFGTLLRKGEPMTPQRFRELQQGEAEVAATSSDGRGVLLCDCDGTLVETERDGHRVAFNKAFEEKGYDCEWDVELYGELLRTGGGKERMARYFTDFNTAAWPHEEPPAKDHPAIMELHKLKTQLFMDIVRSGDLPLREGVLDLISAADAAGWTIAVCSTSNEESVKAVVETMLPDFAPSIRIFAGDCVEAKKPDPAVYLLAARELGVAPMRCVVVEDTNIGLLAGKAAGMQVIVTKSIYSEGEDFGTADVVVASADELDFGKEVMTMLPSMEFA